MLVVLLACAGSGTEPKLGPDAPTDMGLTADTGGSDTGEPSGTDTSDCAPADAWERFELEREDHLRALAEPILACVARSDTPSPVFDGCYDWHSAVHGHWALLALGRVLGDEGFTEAAELSFTAEGVAAELDAVEAGRADEIPYGYAWLLALAVERQRAGESDLDPLAEAVADGLELYLLDLPPAGARAGVLASEYTNISWAVVHLHAWAVATGDAERAASAEDFAREVLLPVSCPVEADRTDTSGFLPPCLVRAYALRRILPDEASWLADVPEDPDLPPVTEITSAHVAGLNFSRAWGLWTLTATTGDERWRDVYLEHLQWHLDHPEYWAENYDLYAHWVAQFGVYAIVEGIDRP